MIGHGLDLIQKWTCLVTVKRYDSAPAPGLSIVRQPHENGWTYLPRGFAPSHHFRITVHLQSDAVEFGSTMPTIWSLGSVLVRILQTQSCSFVNVRPLGIADS
jgi:hypothetical protein